MAAKADAVKTTRKFWNTESRIAALETQLQDLYRLINSRSTDQIGGAIPYLINLDQQLFCKQSVTGPSGAMAVGLMDVVFVEPTDNRPFGGVGPTGGQRGFWSRGSGLV